MSEQQHPLMIEQDHKNESPKIKKESRSITNKELRIIFHGIIIQQTFIYSMFWLCYYVIQQYPANRVLFIVSIPFTVICQFYFAFRKDIKKIESKELFDIINVVLFFIFIGFFYFNIYKLASSYVIYISTMVFITHIALYIYVQLTDTLLNDRMAWLIVLVIPYITISILYIPLFQWSFTLMLYLIRDIEIQGEFTEVEALVLASQMNGLVPQMLVYPFQLILGPRDCKNEFLETCDENTRLDYFRKSATTFSVYQLFLALSIQYYNLGLDSIDFYYEEYPILFWISVGVCVVCWPLIMLLHRHLSADALWILASVYSVFYTFIVVGICSYFYQKPYLIENLILMEEIIAMLFGLSLGLTAYANIPKEKYSQKEALVYMLISPILIFICLIYFFSTHTPIYVLYSFLSLLAICFYIMFVLIEVHLQTHNNLIKLKDSEYQIGALMLYQPIQKMLIRFVLLVMKLFEED